MNIYIAGPMSGIPQFNYPAFYEAAEILREKGYEVTNPAEVDDPEDQAVALASTDGLFATTDYSSTWGDFLSRDVKLVADEVDGVCLLQGWAASRGARLEAYVALTVQKPVYELREGILIKVHPGHVMREITSNTINQGDVSRYKENTNES